MPSDIHFNRPPSEIVEEDCCCEGQKYAAQLIVVAQVLDLCMPLCHTPPQKYYFFVKCLHQIIYIDDEVHHFLQLDSVWFHAATKISPSVGILKYNQVSIISTLLSSKKCIQSSEKLYRSREHFIIVHFLQEILTIHTLSILHTEQHIHVTSYSKSADNQS